MYLFYNSQGRSWTTQGGEYQAQRASRRFGLKRSQVSKNDRADLSAVLAGILLRYLANSHLRCFYKQFETTKDKLDTINSVQGASSDELEKQLDESKQIYSKMQQNLQGDILNNLIDIALACDEDEDMVLSDAEIDKAILRLEGIHGLDLDNEGIRQAIIDNGRSLEGAYLSWNMWIEGKRKDL